MPKPFKQNLRRKIMANEPVAWHYPDGKPDQCTTNKAYAEKEPAWTPMYYKHEWVGLTDDEVKKIIGSDRYSDLLKAVVQTVQAKLKEKNNG
jgi:hypothetical protein